MVASTAAYFARCLDCRNSPSSFFCILCCTAFCSCSKSDLGTEAQPLRLRTAAVSGDLKPEAREVDLGLLGPDAIPRHTYSVVNTSSSSFKIRSVKKSCSCQSVDATAGTQVASGATLKVNYELPKGNGGELSGDVVLLTDSAQHDLSQIKLALTATVPKVIWATPEALIFSDRSDRSNPQQLKVESDIDGLFESPLDITTERGLVNVHVLERAKRHLILNVALNRDIQPGDSFDMISVYCGDVRRTSSRIRVRYLHNVETKSTL